MKLTGDYLIGLVAKFVILKHLNEVLESHQLDFDTRLLNYSCLLCALLCVASLLVLTWPLALGFDGV